MEQRPAGRMRATYTWIAAMVAAGAALVASPALLDWSGSPNPARFDPLLSLCLASQAVVEPDRLWAAWSLAPQILLPMLLVLWLYGRGAIAARGDARGRRAPALPEAGCFVAGMALLAVAVVSPLCRLAATMASAHMIQHVLIVGIAPPLVLLGRPLAAMRRGLPSRFRAAQGASADEAGRLGWFGRPGFASLLYGMAIWLSHAPAVYEAALRSPTVHLLLLAFQLAASFLFWTVLLRAAARPEANHGATGGALLMTLFTLIHTGLLGALLTFASRPWYPIFALGPQAWGLTEMEDQQLAGLIMWVPMGAIYLAAGLAVVAQFLRAIERRAY